MTPPPTPQIERLANEMAEMLFHPPSRDKFRQLLLEFAAEIKRSAEP